MADEIVPASCIKCAGILLHRPVLIQDGNYDNLGEWCSVCKISFYNHAKGWRCGHPTCGADSCYSELDDKFECLRKGQHLPHCPTFTEHGLIRGMTRDHLQISFCAKCPACQRELMRGVRLVKHSPITEKEPLPDYRQNLGVSFRLWCGTCLVGYTAENKWSCSHPVSDEPGSFAACDVDLVNFRCLKHFGCCKPEYYGKEVNYVAHFRKKRARVYTFDFTKRKIKGN
jgi:hypothetical protein